jgi:hypothetical protein
MQVACPFATAGQALLHAPQSSSAVARLTHCFPHNVGAPPEHPVAQAKLLALGVQSGAVVGHFALHVPQCAGSERSVSHPFAAS